MSNTFKPPTRNGIGASCVTLPSGPWPTLIDFLLARFPHIERQSWLQRCAVTLVFDQTGTPISPERIKQAPYCAGGKLYYYRAVKAEPVIPFTQQIIYQNAHFLVVDKPHFLPVVPSGDHLAETLLVRLKRQLKHDDLVPVHRIDQGTAGLVLFCKQASSRAAYSELFSRQLVSKTYHAIAPWRAELALPQTRHSRIIAAQHFMLQREVPGPANALSHIRMLKVQGDLARYALQPLTGKRHQLRLHMLGLGAPIVGDALYPQLKPKGEIDFGQPLQLLAKELAFQDPISGQQHHFISQRQLLF